MDHRSTEMAPKQFKLRSARLLITSDFLMRHKDFQQISLVINYELPMKIDNYIHRLKKYARKGVAVNFITDIILEIIKKKFHISFFH